MLWRNKNYCKFRVCICSVGYPANKMNALYYIAIWGLSGPYHIFPHYLIINRIFGKKATEYIIYVFIFSTTLSEIFFILRRIQSDMIINVQRSSRKVPVILVRLKKKHKCSLKWEEPVCSMWTERRTDITKLTVAFRNVANAPKN